MLELSRAKALRDADQLLDLVEKRQSAPEVIWVNPNESEPDFATRCARLHATRPGRILAAVPYGFSVPGYAQAVEFAPKHFELLNPSDWVRYLIGSGGRGTAKSWSVADYLTLQCIATPCRVLCAREFQRSLRESSAHLLADRIRALKLVDCFDIHESEIKCLVNGSEIIFGGLGVNAQSLLSLENVNICWIEQGESISQRSLEILIPTIRAPGSQIIITLNPDSADAPVMQLIDADRPDVRHRHTIYQDNPWWPKELESERVQLLRTDPDAHSHIYLGTTRINSQAQVFAQKYSIEEFTPVLYKPGQPRPANSPRAWDGPYLGADWGFSQDMTALVLCWVRLLKEAPPPVYDPDVIFRSPDLSGPRELYIEWESCGVGIDINNLPELFDLIPGARDYTIRADCSRPETISYMKQHGFRKIVAARKWPNCVQDGVAFLRGFERIFIHPRCVHAAEEFRLYAYKVDRLSGDVLPDLRDDHNHTVDALRYSLETVMKNSSGGATVRRLRI